MPHRAFSRSGTWMFPPTLEELVAADHPARFVGAFVDALDRASWGELGIALDGEARGAAGYHPRALLGVWLYGFMTGVRSSRKLERACWDQLPYLWLTAWQRPDHNTLWRFYQLHREGMRKLLKRTVQTAVRTGLVDLAVQAVDGMKVGGNAAKARTLDQAGLERLLARTEEAINDLEAQNQGGDDPPAPRLPEQLAEQTRLQEQVQKALDDVQKAEGPKRINLTDQDAVLVTTRQGYQVGYNGQAQVAGLDPSVAGRPGLLITAAELVATAGDHGQLLPLRDQSVEHTGVAPEVQLADGGYHSVETLVGCAERGQVVVMPEAQQARTAYRRRKSLPEPVFGILKEQQAARRLLLRGLKHVRAEWSLLATAFNLRTLARCWQAGTLSTRQLAPTGLS